MSKLLAFIAVAVLLNLAALVYAASEPTVRIDTGTLSGVSDEQGVAAYKGIPYAAPPVGKLRWQAPQPASRWDGVKKADHFGNACEQAETHSRLPWTEPFMEQGPTSEDCLYLNVWTAAKSANERRPVMMYIYGGGFNEGAASIAVYDGTEMAAHGVVLVSVNYRVRAFGFLAHPELSNESEHKVSGNYGLLDQIAALEWIHRNIAAFGGDPGKVTIFGQSAGALSVYDLMQSPLAQGLFVRAIAESGPGLISPTMLGGGTMASRLEQGQAWASAKGAHTLAELRALSADQILAPVEGASGPPPSFNPVADGYVLPLPGAALSKQVPLILGMNADDIGVGGGRGGTSVAAYQDAQTKKYGALADQFMKLYPVSTDADVNRMTKASSRDQSRVSIDLWSAGQSKLSPKIYTYYFSRAIPWPEHPEFGAFHTSEVPYVFRNLGLTGHPTQPMDHQVSETMSSYWINFASSGDPNGKDLATWKPYSPLDHTTMEIGEHTGAIPVAAAEQFALQKSYLQSPAH